MFNKHKTERLNIHTNDRPTENTKSTKNINRYFIVSDIYFLN